MHGEYYAVGIGENPYCQLGIKKKMLQSATPLPALSALISHPSDIYVGRHRLLVKDADGHLHAVGYNEYGECGVSSDGDTVALFTAIECDPSDPSTKTIDDIEIVSRGMIKRAHHTLIVTAQNEMYSFGCNDCGQACLGIKTELNSTALKKYA